MPDEVPPISPDQESGYFDFEAKFLDQSAELSRLKQREMGLRFWLKIAASVMGGLVVAGMAAMLWHLMHHLFFFGLFMRVPASVAVVMFLAPVLSITTITVALFVAAFRKFEDKDIDIASSGVSGSINAIKGFV